MSTVLSLPVVQPQPSDAQYSIANITLFKDYDRNTYRQTFGEEAPPFDPSRPVKQWKDDSPNAGSYLIFTVGASGPALTPYSLPKAIASTVNLLGKPNFSVYVPTPTSAYVVQLDGTREVGPRAPLNPAILATRSQAAALAALTKGTVVDGSFQGTFSDVYPPDESRRLWIIRNAAGDVQVGDLLTRENSGGVGHPGHWDAASLQSGQYMWVLDNVYDGTEGPNRFTGDACRPLNASEHLIVVKSMFGSLYCVANSASTDPVAGGSGGLTPAQAATLQEARDAAVAAKTNSQNILNIVQANQPPTA